MPDPSISPYKHILVAVHGIGQQSRNSTVRSVLSMAGENLSQAEPGNPSFSYPLGYFHSDVRSAVKVTPFDQLAGGPEALKGIGFAEVFWADIPQEVVKENRTMEETKAWARTVVARAQDLFCGSEECETLGQTAEPGIAATFKRIAPPDPTRFRARVRSPG